MMYHVLRTENGFELGQHGRQIHLLYLSPSTQYYCYLQLIYFKETMEIYIVKNKKMLISWQQQMNEYNTCTSLG